jgi:hypothetical protein
MCNEINRWRVYREVHSCATQIHSAATYYFNPWHSNHLISVQQDATYSVYYISVGSSTCFGFWHPSSGARTTVITASGIDEPDQLPSALVVELELIHVYRMVGIHLLCITW